MKYHEPSATIPQPPCAPGYTWPGHGETPAGEAHGREGASRPDHLIQDGDGEVMVNLLLTVGGG